MNAYIDLKPNSNDASVIEWYNDSPKLLKANNLTLFAMSPLKNKVIPVEIVSSHYVDPKGERVRSWV